MVMKLLNFLFSLPSFDFCFLSNGSRSLERAVFSLSGKTTLRISKLSQLSDLAKGACILVEKSIIPRHVLQRR